MTPSLDDQIACARRELAMRKRVYKRLIDGNKMTQATALHETACMEAIVDSLLELQTLKGETLL